MDSLYRATAAAAVAATLESLHSAALTDSDGDPGAGSFGFTAAEPFRLQQRKRQHDDRNGLMPQRKSDRHHVQQCQNSQCRLQGDGGRQPQRTADRRDSPRAQRIDRMQDRKDPDGVGQHAVAELHGERVVEEIAPPRHLEEQPRGGRNDGAIDRWPGVEDPSGPQAGHQGAEIELQEHQGEQHRGCDAQPRGRDEAGCGLQPPQRPDDRGKNHQRQHQVRSEPILRDFNPSGEPRCHHPPADRALQPAKPENDPQPALEIAALQPAAPQKPQERQQVDRADHAAQQPMAPLPPEDGLELVETHAVVEFAILRNGLVGLERIGPRLLGQRRQGTGHRLPLDDRQPGLGETGGAADQHHGDDQGCDGHEPDPHGTQMTGLNSAV